MRKSILCIVFCAIVLSFVGCGGKTTPKSTMEKWVKSIDDFNAKMMTVQSKDIAKEAIKKHVSELQAVMAEIREWGSELPEEKRGDALAKELEFHTIKFKDKTFIGAYLASQMNALRYSMDDSALKIEYDMFVSLDKQIKQSFTSLGVPLERFAEVKQHLTKITEIFKSFTQNLSTADSGPKLLEEIDTFISKAKGHFPELNRLREGLDIKDWNENTPDELKDHVKKMKAAMKNMLMALMLKNMEFEDTPGLKEKMNNLTNALK